MNPFNPNLPNYLIVTPLKVDSDDEGTSSDEEFSGEFPQEMFENPLEYFKVPSEDSKDNEPKDLRGSISLELKRKGSFKGESNEECKRLLDLFEKASFKIGGAIGQTLEPRVSVMLGLNKMRSMSTRKNRALKKAFNAIERCSIRYSKIAFYWDGIYKVSCVGSEPDSCVWKVLPYEKIRKFYKQLKKVNPQLATEFQQKLESRKSEIVPYREIRDFIKNHTATKNLVKSFRDKSPQNDIYMVFFDADIQSLYRNTKSKGPLTLFDEYYLQKKYDIFSTGYLIKEPTNKPLELAVKADLTVRNAIAKHLKRGIYPTEPCMLIKILKGEETIEENFSSPSDTKYLSPKEMPILIDKILKKRNLDPQDSMLFDSRGAIVTQCPKRMIREFSTVETNSNGLILWNLKDFSTMRDISQTHYNSRDFAKYLIKSLDIATSVQVENYELSDSKVFSDLLISIISRIFNAYDPIERAKKIASEKEISFQKSLIEIINSDSEPIITEIPPSNVNRSYPRPRKNAVKKGEAIRKASAIKKIWKEIDASVSQDDLLVSVNILTNVDRSNEILQAVKESAKSLCLLFRKKLCLNYEELVIHSLATITNKSFTEILQKIPTCYLDIIHGSSLINSSPTALIEKFKESSIDDFYGITPLHLASLSGYKKLIEFILEKDESLGSLSSIDQQGLTPFDYALKYSEINGLRLDLLAITFDKSYRDTAEEFISKKINNINSYALILNVLLEKEKINGVYSNSKKLFLTAVYEDLEPLAKELIERHEFDEILRDEVLKFAPDVNHLLMKWVDEEILMSARELYDEDSFEGMMFDQNLKIAGYLDGSDMGSEDHPDDTMPSEF